MVEALPEELLLHARAEVSATASTRVTVARSSFIVPIRYHPSRSGRVTSARLRPDLGARDGRVGVEDEQAHAAGGDEGPDRVCDRDLPRLAAATTRERPRGHPQHAL